MYTASCTDAISKIVLKKLGLKSGVPFNLYHVTGIIKTQLKDDKQCYSHIWNWLV